MTLIIIYHLSHSHRFAFSRVGYPLHPQHYTWYELTSHFSYGLFDAVSLTNPTIKSHFLISQQTKRAPTTVMMKNLLLLGLLFFRRGIEAQELDCSFQGEDFIQLRNGALTMRHVMNQIDETLTVELVYEGEGWISLGLSQRGKMVGSYAVIALPDQPVGATNPGKYYMGGETVNTVRLMPTAQQTLTDTSITQNSTHTTMKFTKPLVEAGELAISATAQNTFIYATGFSNALSLHNHDGVIRRVLTPCRAAIEIAATTTIGGTTSTPPSNTQTEIVTETTVIENTPTLTETVSTVNPTNTEMDWEEEDEDTGDSDSDSEDDEDPNNIFVGSTNTAFRPASNGGTGGQEIDCSLQSEASLLRNGRLTMRHVMNPIDETLTVELVYEGEGWLGFGFSANGRMTNALAVIGLPDQPLGPTNPGKYFMGGRTLGSVQLVPDEEQTLTDTSITQNATHTTMKFTKRLVEAGELAIDANGQNRFIYATGIVNGLSGHNHDGAFAMKLTQCRFANGGGNSAGASDGSASSLNSDLNFLGQGGSIRQLWIWHGVLMALSWGILMPLAIGSSMLRDILCLPPGVWLKLHYSLNMFAIACMIVSFAIAVHATNANTVAGEDPHHFDDPKHRTIGLMIFLIVFLQAASGFMRPNGPKKPAAPVEAPKDVEGTVEIMNESDDFETTRHSNSTSDDEEVSSNPKESVKSIARRIWEYKHRIMGLGLMGLSWYNCDSGLELYAERYGEDYDLSGAFWGVTGGLSGLICILYALQIARR
jgi:hypothetical protein